MVEYFIFSGVSCFVAACLANYTTKVRSEELGYVGIAEKERITPKKFVAGLLSYFIPVVNNIVGLVLFACSTFMVFAKDETVAKVFDKSPKFAKASHAKEIYEYRAKNNDFASMEDAMRLDGADEKTIKEELKVAKSSSGVLSDKEMKKINAMSDAELWLLDIEMNTGLTEEEKKALYVDYVKEFSKDKAKPKAIEKTIKMMSKINR